MYPNSETEVDCTGVGAAVVDDLIDIDAHGFIFTGKSKVDMLTNMQKMFESHGIKSPWLLQPVNEFNFYEWEDKELVTDCVMAMGVLLWPLKELTIPEVPDEVSYHTEVEISPV